MEDNRTVCIPVDKYTGLLRSLAKLEILHNAYRIMSLYDLEHVLDAVFSSEEKYRGEKCKEGGNA